MAGIDFAFLQDTMQKSANRMIDEALQKNADKIDSIQPAPWAAAKHDSIQQAPQAAIRTDSIQQAPTSLANADKIDSIRQAPWEMAEFGVK